MTVKINITHKAFLNKRIEKYTKEDKTKLCLGRVLKVFLCGTEVCLQA